MRFISVMSSPAMNISDMNGHESPTFTTHFYVYQYATGFSAAVALSRRILEGGPQAVADYKRFLTLGSSMYPVDELKIAGVDMTSKEPIKDALVLFRELVDELESLL